MFQNNKELRFGFGIFTVLTVILSAVGFAHSTMSGILVMISCLAAMIVYCATEFHRYRKLQKLSQDLDNLLSGSAPMPIWEYNEGELSILANQIQKITLQLTESAETSQSDKQYLADSLADISHQLRTPLTAMNLTATMLREPNLPNEKRIALSRDLQSLLARTDWLVESLLKLSKLDAGTVTLVKEPVSVRELIQRASAPMEIPMDLRNQQFVVNCAEERFLGDLVWSSEALGNILKNCMEHTPDGGTITVTALETALFTQIEVTDTGSGFQAEDLPHLFERFYRGSNASQTSYGIGLALARTVIVSQNGTVQAMNTQSGAKFVIKFYKQII